MGAACPTMAEVNGVRYSMGVSRELPGIEAALSPYGSITRTNVPEYFAESTVYAITGIDPAVALVARATSFMPEDNGPYRLMFVLQGNSDAAWPEICQYLTPPERGAGERCAGVTPT